MRIACVAVDDQSIVTFCRTMSTLLAERGHTLVTVGSVGTHRDELASVLSEHIDCGPSRYPAPLEDLRYVVRLRRALGRARADLVILFTTKPNTLGSLAVRLGGTRRYVVAVRGLGQAFDDGGSPRDAGSARDSDGVPGASGRAARARRAVIRRLTFRLYAHAFRHCEMAWFTNEADRDYFVTRGACDPARTYLSTNAIDLEEFDPGAIPDGALDALRSELGIPAGDVVVVMIARLLRQKGVREYVEAAAVVRRRLPGTHFLLLAPPEPDSDDRIPESYLYENRDEVRWLGLRKDVRELCALCDIAVLPSYYREGGFPRALLEPMAMGKAVIAADTPACRGPVVEGHNGLLVPPRDPGALADALLELIGDPARRAEMGAASRTRVEEHFDDATVLSALLDRLGIP